ncbi:MAG: sigma-70 family RNA polymerase sigma factor [Firmicutes bacterium]|nr:sigma-70 family RNA polymerase sigma factor [Bacillota bacterium]
MKVKEFNLFLQKICKGDKAKIKLIYNSYRELIIFIAFEIVKNSEIADKIMSDFFKRILDGAYGKEYIDNPINWIATTIRGLAIRYMQKDNASHPSDTYIKLLSDSIKVLTDKEREIFNMYYLCKYELNEISEVLEYPQAAIKEDIYNINEKLRHLQEIP